jgi:hypothetical protein
MELALVPSKDARSLEPLHWDNLNIMGRGDEVHVSPGESSRECRTNK